MVSGTLVLFTVSIENNVTPQPGYNQIPNDNRFGNRTTRERATDPSTLATRRRAASGTVTGDPGSNHVNTVTASVRCKRARPSPARAVLPWPITSSAPEAAGRAGDSPQDLVIITNAGVWGALGIQRPKTAQAQSNPVSNPANYKQLYLPLIIRR